MVSGLRELRPRAGKPCGRLDGLKRPSAKVANAPTITLDELT
jgi:hypothetical protein